MTDDELKLKMRKAWKEFEDNMNEGSYYDVNGREEDKVQKLIKKKKNTDVQTEKTD